MTEAFPGCENVHFQGRSLFLRDKPLSNEDSAAVLLVSAGRAGQEFVSLSAG